MRKIWKNVKNFFIGLMNVKKMKEELKIIKITQDNMIKMIDELNQDIKIKDKELNALYSVMENHKGKIEGLEKFMESAKFAVKETARSSELEKKRKWLYGYPDETRKEE